MGCPIWTGFKSPSNFQPLFGCDPAYSAFQPAPPTLNTSCSLPAADPKPQHDFCALAASPPSSALLLSFFLGNAHIGMQGVLLQQPASAWLQCSARRADCRGAVNFTGWHAAPMAEGHGRESLHNQRVSGRKQQQQQAKKAGQWMQAGREASNARAANRREQACIKTTFRSSWPRASSRQGAIGRVWPWWVRRLAQQAVQSAAAGTAGPPNSWDSPGGATTQPSRRTAAG